MTLENSAITCESRIYRMGTAVDIDMADIKYCPKKLFLVETDEQIKETFCQEFSFSNVSNQVCTYKIISTLSRFLVSALFRYLQADL